MHSTQDCKTQSSLKPSTSEALNLPVNKASTVCVISTKSYYLKVAEGTTEKCGKVIAFKELL